MATAVAEAVKSWGSRGYWFSYGQARGREYVMDP